MAQSRRLQVANGEIVSLLDNQTTTDPTVNDDSGDGYAIGSVWHNTTTDTTFVALDVTPTAAVWRGIVAGPATATAWGIPTFNGATGKLLQSNVVTLYSGAFAGGKNFFWNEEYDNGNSGASKTITWTNGQKQKVTLTDDTTLTLATMIGNVGNYLLRIIQDGTGGRSVAWSAAVKWPGTAPDFTALTAGQYTIVSFYWDGTNYSAQCPKDVSGDAIPFT